MLDWKRWVPDTDPSCHGAPDWIGVCFFVTGQAGKSRNIILVWFVWPLITLGIYHFVWYYKVNREAKDFDRRIEVNPAMAVVAISLGWLLIVPPFVSYYNTGQRIARMQRSAGMQPTCNPWIGLILVFILSLHSLYYQQEMNQIWNRYHVPAEGEQVTLAA